MSVDEIVREVERIAAELRVEAKVPSKHNAIVRPASREDIARDLDDLAWRIRAGR